MDIITISRYNFERAFDYKFFHPRNTVPITRMFEYTLRQMIHNEIADLDVHHPPQVVTEIVEDVFQVVSNNKAVYYRRPTW